MREATSDLLDDIDETIHQLLENAEALKIAKFSDVLIHEVSALEKTQESLLARLMHRQSLLEMDEKKKTLESIRKETIEQKVVEYAKSLKNRRQKAARARKPRSKSRG